MHSRRHLAEFMASMHLVQSTTNGFSNSLRSLLWRGQQVKDTLDGLRRAYTSEEVANVVLDGTLSFPTAPTQVTTGISLEFRYALRTLRALLVTFQHFAQCPAMYLSNTLVQKSMRSVRFPSLSCPDNSAYVPGISSYDTTPYASLRSLSALTVLEKVLYSN